MGLKSDCFSFVLSKSADSWGWDSSEERLGDGHTSGLPHRSISIVDDGRLEVCDSAHWAFVMKKVKGPALRFAIGRASPPPRETRVILLTLTWPTHGNYYY